MLIGAGCCCCIRGEAPGAGRFRDPATDIRFTVSSPCSTLCTNASLVDSISSSARVQGRASGRYSKAIYRRICKAVTTDEGKSEYIALLICEFTAFEEI